jgi:hypothetical protein
VSRRKRATDTGSADESRIVVHVHVHRDGKPAKEKAARSSGKRRARPRLSGALFDWKSHYLPVARWHHEALENEASEADLGELIEQLRNAKR